MPARPTPHPDGPHPDEPDVDVVIAVHTDARPIERAVGSVLGSGLEPPQIRVTVVCHNIDAASIARRLRPLTEDPALRDAARLIELHDGTRSPAGPFNHGIDHATGRFVSIMGSDDTVDLGTYAAWLAIADAHRSSAVVASLRTMTTGRVPTPAVRPGHALDLDPIRDGLAYRTAPLGLVRRTEIERLGLRLTEGLPTGEDQEFSARLWFGGGRIDYAADAGDYVVHDDQDDRVTLLRYDLATLFRFATHLVEGDWFPRQDDKVRAVLVTKILRVHVVPAITALARSGGWDPAQRHTAKGIVDTIVAAAPRGLASLSAAERAAIDGLRDPTAPLAELTSAAARAREFGRPTSLLTRDPRHLLRPDAPIRWVAASAVMTARDRLGRRGQPMTSSTKHQRHASPGSNERITG
ncbi:MAG: glycosyltransferase family 2 protein [Micrococcales bacterium]|nr:glycosyltransferase family 2 protein [Micrococcales bacterium]